MFRISDEELIRAGNASSISHKNGGYVVGLGLSHSLHCLVSPPGVLSDCRILIVPQKRIKQYVRSDYYYHHEKQDWDDLEMHAGNLPQLGHRDKWPANLACQITASKRFARCYCAIRIRQSTHSYGHHTVRSNRLCTKAKNIPAWTIRGCTIG